MSLWAKALARWRAHDERLMVRELKRESAEPDSSIPDVGHIQGVAGAPGSSVPPQRAIHDQQEPPQGS